MVRNYTSILIFSAAALFASCSDDNPGVDASVVIADSAPPDATVLQCASNETECSGVCVNTNSSSLHCGGCDQACQSPGQICGGALPCSCPADFIPAVPAPIFEQVNAQADPLLLGIGAYSDGVLNVLIVGYELATTDVGVDIDLATTQPPYVAVGYDVDVAAFTAQTNYLATEGTLNLTAACAMGVQGTVTNAVFSEVAAQLDPTPIPNGCTIAVPSITFSIGEDCPPRDAGPDAMP